MPTQALHQSIFVNRGLGARAALNGSNDLVDGSDIEPGVTGNVVEAFKHLVSDQAFAQVDGDLAEMSQTISGFSLPADFATYFINAKYAELGGANSVVGAPTGSVGPTGNAGFLRRFQNGVICWHADVGAHELHGRLLERWESLGAAGGFLGFPTTDVMPGQDVRAAGLFAHFQGGSIYWAPLLASMHPYTVAPVSLPGKPATEVPAAVLTAGAACEVHGAIRERYLALGAEAGILGYPRSDQQSTPDGLAEFNKFQGGAIYSTRGTGAHEIHGLIHELWANADGVRTPQVGYPISDELIPDRRIGHRIPEVNKKPELTLPADVIKLPSEAATAGFPAGIVNSASARLTATGGGSATQAQGRTAAARAASTVKPLPPSASTPVPARSVNRFADFENGVLFWQRGAPAAIALAPLAHTGDGMPLLFSGADVATIAVAKIGKATFELPGTALASITFAGTTAYAYDGIQVHNRRHRIELVLAGFVQETHLGIPLTVPQTAQVELLVQANFDPLRRRIVLMPTGWTILGASSGSLWSALEQALRGRLDPLLWREYELLTLPDTDAGKPIAVLSVKTLANGTLAVFVEPSADLAARTLDDPAAIVRGLAKVAARVPPQIVGLSNPS